MALLPTSTFPPKTGARRHGYPSSSVFSCWVFSKWPTVIFIAASTNKEMFTNMQSNAMFSRHLRWKWWLAEFRSMLLLILRLSTLKQAPIHILCSIYIYYFSFLLLVKHIHTQTNLQKLKQARFTYCATKYLIFKHILISACTLVFKRSIKIYFQIFDAKKRKNDSSRELGGRKNQ